MKDKLNRKNIEVIDSYLRRKKELRRSKTKNKKIQKFYLGEVKKYL